MRNPARLTPELMHKMLQAGLRPGIFGAIWVDPDDINLLTDGSGYCIKDKEHRITKTYKWSEIFWAYQY